MTWYSRPAKLKQRLEELAKAEGRSLSNVVVRLLREALAKTKRGVGTDIKIEARTICVLVLALWPAPVCAAELPNEMIGVWCGDKWKTLEAVGSLDGGEFYHTRADDVGECNPRIASGGNFSITKHGVVFSAEEAGRIRLDPQSSCTFDKVELIAGGVYRVSMTCKDETEIWNLEIIDGFLVIRDIPEG
jgi:hypothetical protein